MNSLQMKAEQAAYWRFVRQMPLVAVEALDEDILVVTGSRKKVIVEIKVSIADLRHDILKPKHASIRQALGLPFLAEQERMFTVTYPERYIPNSFYFAITARMWNTEKVREILTTTYPYAGVISVMSMGGIPGRASEVVKQAQELKKTKLTLIQISKLVKAQSASLANAYAHLAEQAANLKEFRAGISGPKSDTVKEEDA
jgi:hypothetical protein